MMSTIEDRIRRLERDAARDEDPALYRALARLYLRVDALASAMTCYELAMLCGDSGEAREEWREARRKHGVLCIPRRRYEAVVRRLDERINSRWHAWRPSPMELPRGHETRAIMLRHFIDPLTPGVRLTPGELERRFNEVIERYRLMTDHCHLRRYMLSLRLLRREIDGSAYWRNPEPPVMIV